MESTFKENKRSVDGYRGTFTAKNSLLPQGEGLSGWFTSVRKGIANRTGYSKQWREKTSVTIKNTVTRKGSGKEKEGHHNFIVERDAFIAHRIDETLDDGETAILFLGMLHKVDKKLPPDV